MNAGKHNNQARLIGKIVILPIRQNSDKNLSNNTLHRIPKMVDNKVMLSKDFLLVHFDIFLL